MEQDDVPVTHKDPIHAIAYNQNFKQLITCSDGSVRLIQFEIVVLVGLVVVVAAAATTTIAVIIIVVVVIIIIITVVIIISVTDGRTDRVTTAKACV